MLRSLDATACAAMRLAIEAIRDAGHYPSAKRVQARLGRLYASMSGKENAARHSILADLGIQVKTYKMQQGKRKAGLQPPAASVEISDKSSALPDEMVT